MSFSWTFWSMHLINPSLIPKYTNSPNEPSLSITGVITYFAEDVHKNVLDDLGKFGNNLNKKIFNNLSKCAWDILHSIAHFRNCRISESSLVPIFHHLHYLSVLFLLLNWRHQYLMSNQNGSRRRICYFASHYFPQWNNLNCHCLLHANHYDTNYWHVSYICCRTRIIVVTCTYTFTFWWRNIRHISFIPNFFPRIIFSLSQ